MLVPRKIFDSQKQVKTRDTSSDEPSAHGAPVLVWIDGGGYAAGYKHEQNARGLVTRAQQLDGQGFIFVAMNYRVGLFVS